MVRQLMKRLPSIFQYLGAVLAFILFLFPVQAAYAQDDNSKNTGKKRTKTYGASSLNVPAQKEPDGVGEGAKATSESKRGRVWIAKSRSSQEQITKRLKQTLQKIENRLENTSKTPEKDALIQAQNDLYTALDRLSQQRLVLQEGFQLQAENDPSRITAAKGLELQDYDLNSLRLSAPEQIDDVRGELQQNIGDVEMEIGLNGEVKSLRIHSAGKSPAVLEGDEAERLAAILHAEQALKQAETLLATKGKKKRYSSKKNQ